MKKLTLSIIGGIAAFAVAFTVGCSTHSTAEHSHGTDTKQVAAKPYPLKICVVSGEELGSMGKPVKLTQDGQEVQFCCENCVDTFKAEPEKYVAQLKAGVSTESTDHDGEHSEHGEHGEHDNDKEHQ